MSSKVLGNSSFENHNRFESRLAGYLEALVPPYVP